MFAVVSLHNVGPIRRRHEVRSRGARTAASLQVVRLHEPPFQSEMALQSLRQGPSPVQGSRARVSGVSHEFIPYTYSLIL